MKSSLPKVYITDYIEDPDIESQILTEHLVDGHDPQAQVVMVWHHKIDEDFIRAHPQLRGVQRYGVGFDNIDLAAAKRHGVQVCNNPDYGVDEVSDTAIAMAMSLTRGLWHYDHHCRDYQNGTWQENTHTPLRRTNELRFSVIGAGRIGSACLLKAKSLGFKTGFFDPYLVRGYEKVVAAQRYESLEECLSSSDVISLHVPLSESTKGMVDKSFLSSMRPGSYLINTARGKLIEDLDGLYAALERQHLQAVGLDVLPHEPPAAHPLIEAWRKRRLNGRLIINPHSAYYSRDAYQEMRRNAAFNALRMLNGQTPYNLL